LRRLACGLENGLLVVRGRVPSRYLKQAGVTCLLGLGAGVGVVDLIEVEPQRPAPGSGAGEFLGKGRVRR
jgi:hypothetical protein